MAYSKGEFKAGVAAMKRRLAYFVWTLIGLATPCAYRQAVNATLLGTVTDSTDAAVANAKVWIAAQNTGISRTGRPAARCLCM